MGKKYILEIEENKDGSFAWSNFAPYTAPDLERVRKEGYEEGRKVGIKDGMCEAWEVARKIGSESMYGLEKMGFDFSQCVIADYNPSWFVIKNYSASEAIEKIRQYEQEQDRQARIEYNFDEIKDVLETTAKECNVSLDEIAEVLQKMKE